MIRRLLPWVAGVGVATISLVFLAWLIVAGQIEERALAWAEMRRAEGYTVTWTSLDVGGFPSRFDLDFAGPRLAKDGWAAEAPSLRAQFLPWRPGRVDLAAPRLALAGPEMAGDLEQVAAEVRIEGGQATQVAIDGIAATGRFRGADQGRADRARLVVDSFSPGTTDWKAESLAGTVSLWGVRPAPPYAAQMLFPDPFDLAVTGAIKGPIVDLAGWRDAGGTLELNQLALVWGPMKLDGSATLALDGQMRPLGAGTARLQGLNPVLDRLVAKGQIRAQDATIGKMVLGLLAQPAADGGSEVSVPITAQDGKLSLGPVPVATLRPLVESRP